MAPSEWHSALARTRRTGSSPAADRLSPGRSQSCSRQGRTLAWPSPLEAETSRGGDLTCSRACSRGRSPLRAGSNVAVHFLCIAPSRHQHPMWCGIVWPPFRRPSSRLAKVKVRKCQMQSACSGMSPTVLGPLPLEAKQAQVLCPCSPVLGTYSILWYSAAQCKAIDCVSHLYTFFWLPRVCMCPPTLILQSQHAPTMPLLRLEVGHLTFISNELNAAVAMSGA